MSQHGLLPCSQPLSPWPGDWDRSVLPWRTAPTDTLPLPGPGSALSSLRHRTGRNMGWLLRECAPEPALALLRWLVQM